MAKEISIGDRIPGFELENQNGQMVRVDQNWEKALVIYFYPKDDTPGCTAQACSLRDSYQDFVDAGADVIGISSDDADSHKAFAKKHSLPFILLADTKGDVRKKFGVPTNLLGLLPGRVTYVFDSEGLLIHKFSSQTRIFEHSKQALKSLKA